MGSTSLGATQSRIVLTEEFRQTLDWLHAGENVFLTGKAGTGKSTLIRTFLEATDRNVQVLAPTGVAALNVDGFTIHRFFSLHPTLTVEDIGSSNYYPGRFASVIKALDTLIIDEVSMVRADLFDMLAIALRRFGPKPGTPFGGVQLVLVGDLFQLPPVVQEGESEFFRTHYETPFFFASPHFNREKFRSMALTKVFRQSDPTLVNLLNSVRDGRPGPEAFGVLEGLVQPDFEPPLDEFWLTLTTTRKRAETVNNQALSRIDDPTFRHESTVVGELGPWEPPTPDLLEFKIGAQVMLLNNDSLGRWVNGSLGRVVAWDPDEKTASVQLSARHGGRTVSVTPHTWEVTVPEVVGGKLTHVPVGTYQQLPFCLAWAISIHKSQGQTLDRMVVDLTGGAFAEGQLYVALSRCTSLEGLVLSTEAKPKDLRVALSARRFMRTVNPVDAPQGTAYLGVCFVGDVGRNWRPRPVEIAMVTDDGVEFSTLVDPHRDTGDARTRFGITAPDLQIAPSLPEAWGLMTRAMQGRQIAGIDVDEHLAWIDYELKRLGLTPPPVLGVDVLAGQNMTAEGGVVRRAYDSLPTALERARYVRELAGVEKLTLEGDPLESPVGITSAFLLPRWDSSPEFIVEGTAAPATEGLVRKLLRKAEYGLTARNAQLVAQLAQQLGDAEVAEEILRSTSGGSEATGEEVFHPGAQVCFSGSAVGPDGVSRSKEELHGLAAERGLLPVKAMTMSKCDVLVVAEEGSQSEKARKAAAWGKPVVGVDKFLAWCGLGVGQVTAPAAEAPPEVTVRYLV